MLYQIIGIEKTSFRPRDSDREFAGVRLHCTYEKEKVDGMAVESVYCNSSVDVSGLSVGDLCEIFYNKFGKVSEVRKVG